MAEEESKRKIPDALNSDGGTENSNFPQVDEILFHGRSIYDQQAEPQSSRGGEEGSSSLPLIFDRTKSQPPPDVNIKVKPQPKSVSKRNKERKFNQNTGSFKTKQMKYSLSRSQTAGQILENTKLHKIKEMHDDFNPMKQGNQCSNSKDFMKKVMYSVPLNKLYEVLASCQFNENADFCPVLVKIVDYKILEINENFPYLLQVWTKFGQMVFERSLHQPVSNWNISHDRFIFQESQDSPDIYVVHLYLDKQPYLSKFRLPDSVTKNRSNSTYWSKDKNRFIIPPEELHQSEAFPVDGTENEKQDGDSDGEEIDYDDQAAEVLDKDLPTLKHENNQNKIHRRRSYTMDMSQLQEMLKQQDMNSLTKIDNSLVGGCSIKSETEHSVSQVMQDQIIVRTPDKMIDYLQGYILLAFRDTIIYCKVSDYGEEDVVKNPESRPSGDLSSAEDPNFFSVEIPESNLCQLDLNRDFKIICIQEIGEGMSALVLEDIKTRQIRFLRAFYQESDEQGQRKLQLVQLGVMVNFQQDFVVSPLLKYRSITKFDERTSKFYNVGLVLRMNGKFEVYSDFMLVSEYMDPDKQCVDIESDFNQFLLKFVKNSDKVTEQTDLDELEIEIRQIRHFWRNRISYSTSNLKKDNDKWNYVLHHRISQHFCLYSQILNFSMHMLVSHRNMISVFDMSKGIWEEACWIDTVQFDEGFIRKMFIKKRDKQERQDLIKERKLKGKNCSGRSKQQLSVFKKYRIILFIGIHTIKMIELSSKGVIKRQKISMDPGSSGNEESDRIIIYQETVQIPGRIISFQDDDMYHTGMLVLTDDKKDETPEYKIIEGCRVQLFPLKQIDDDVVTLHSLKQGRLYKLMDSKQSDCVAYDSYYKVMKANNQQKEPALVQSDDDESDDNRQLQNNIFSQRTDVHGKSMNDAQQFIKLVVIQNPKKTSSKMFQIVKEYGDDKTIRSIRLIDDHIYQKQINHESLDQDDKPLHSFFTNSTDFGNNINTYAHISEKFIKIFDKDMQLRLQFEGFNIRNCVDLHQGYLYTISDGVMKPYEVTDLTNEDGPQRQSNFKYRSNGLFVFDIQKLFLGEIERYKLTGAVGGVCNFIDISKFSNRLSYVQNYNKIAVVPFPHLNLINCVGMRQKHHYLLWREKNGFFTALDRTSNLLTWSLISGKLLYGELQNKDGQMSEMKNYEVYKSDQDDITYTQDFYNFDDHSVMLLKKKYPVRQEVQLHENKPNELQQLLKSKIIKQALDQVRNINEKGTVNISKKIRNLKQDLFTSNSQMQIDVLNSQSQAELYHFKVMQLSTHEDTQAGSDCKLRFHFLFNMMKTIPREDLKSFDWDINSSPCQKLWLSKDTKLMMEVINNFIARVYRRVNIDDDGNVIPESQLFEDDGQVVKWVVDYQIKRFPRSLVDMTSIPYLFSPNFTYQLDFKYLKKQFLIRETRSQEVYLEIPQSMVNMQEWDHAQGEGAIQIIASRIKWDSEKMLRIINEGNIECIFEICSSDPSDKDPSLRYLKLRSSVKIDNEYENMTRRDSPHMISQPVPLPQFDVLERLIRMNQSYKTSLQHAINLGDKKFQIQDKVNKVDYLQKWGGQCSSFDVELSFTWLDWRILELIISEDVFSIENIDKEQALQLCFNIWPKGRGVLHQLVIGSQQEIKQTNLAGDQIQAYWAAIELFKIANQKHKVDLTGDSVHEEGISIEIPVLPDFYGATPLDMCLGINNLRESELWVYTYKDRDSDKLQKQENQAMAEVIFKNIKDYGYMHSSQIIHEAIIKATRIGLKNIGAYLESRMMKVTHCFESSTQHMIRKDRIKKTPSMGLFGLIESNVWEPEEKMKEEMFDAQGAMLPMVLLYIDIPYLFKQTSFGMDFIKALSESEDLSIFQLQSVQIIIGCHNAYWRKRHILAFGIPLVIQLILVWYWSNILLPNLEKVQSDFDFAQQSDIAVLTINLISIYLLIMQVPQMWIAPKQFFSSFENLLSLSNQVMLLQNTINLDTESTVFWTVQSWIALTMWLRFVMYLRSFAIFSWYVRMIGKTMSGMIMFFIVFFIGVMSFADAFQSIDSVMKLNGIAEAEWNVTDESSDYSKYIAPYMTRVHYSFLAALGDFTFLRLENYREQDYVIFILCAVFNIILLFNLLIAIISEIYQGISDSQIETSYKEKALHAASLQETFFGMRQMKFDHNQRLFVAKVITSDQIKEDEDVLDQIQQAESNILQQMEHGLNQQKEQLKMDFEEKLDLLSQALSKKLGEGESAQSQRKSLMDYVQDRERIQKRLKKRQIYQAIENNTDHNRATFDAMSAFLSTTKKHHPSIHK